MDESNFVITKLYKATPTAKPKRDGTLALFMPESQNSFRIRAEYREGAQEPVNKEKGKDTPQTSKAPCLAPFSEITVCADIDFDPLIRPSFHDLEEGFFDDVLITDSGGNVLYQESVDGIRIENLNTAIALSAANNSDSLLAKITPGGKPSPSGEAPQVFSSFSQTSTQKTVTLGGSDYELYLQPLPVLLKQEKQDQSLVLCGLRTLKHAHAQTLALPYTYLLWGILVLLAIFALGWPMLKLQYMNPKERLQSRQILYLIASVLLGTELITLIALNASYTLITDEISKSELSQLADQINRNVQNELHDSLSTLDLMAKDENLLKLVAPVSKTGEPQGDEGTQGSFLNTYDTKFKIDNLAYPYFSYFFLADENGWQRLKVTINPTRTPWTNVKNQPFYRPVRQHQLSHFVGDGKIPDFRIDPLYSPNTGEFLVVLAAPWVAPSKADVYSPKLSAEVLAIKMESLLRPVLPEGYGYAVVDGAGKVLFDSMAVRNLNENFIKEARNSPSLIAALNEGSTTYLDLRYMGTDKKLWITPLRCLSNPRLTLIVFKDSSYFATVNMSVVITFALLVLTYAIFPAFAIAAIHVLFRKRYPLEIIWPNCDRMQHYLSIFVVNALLSLAYLCAYASYGPERSLITIFAIASVAAGYPFLECRQRCRLLANLMVLAILVVIGLFNSALIFAVVFAVYVFYPRLRQLDVWIVNRTNLKRIYTLTALSVLVIFVVVPSCGFFNISYEYVQRVFVQVQQLDLAEKIEKRDNTIKERYANLEAPAKFHSERLRKMWDRYDLVFSNCNSTPPGGTPLGSNFVEGGIKFLTASLPVNPLAAQLQELAQTKRGLPDKGWEIS
ncbi:MAG TPA: cache domain-containing protein, partial [Nitrososphaera sp.]|nr:cache domain-containing protein [Nitrososphaera sp.]